MERIAKFPSGIKTLDLVCEGGLPVGSFIVLLGDVGSGPTEFAYTSAAMVSLMKSGKLKVPEDAGVKLPDEIWCFTFARSVEDISEEIAHSFSPDFSEALRGGVFYRDLSLKYLRLLPLVTTWTELSKGQRARSRRACREMLETLSGILSEKGKNNLLILHTLTELAHPYSGIMMSELHSFLRGLQRASKAWGGIIYGIMHRGLLEKMMEEEILSCADGVFEFRWQEAGGAERWRTMVIQRLRGLASSVGGAMRFEVRVTPSTGLILSKVSTIEYPR